MDFGPLAARALAAAAIFSIPPGQKPVRRNLSRMPALCRTPPHSLTFPNIFYVLPLFTGLNLPDTRHRARLPPLGMAGDSAPLTHSYQEPSS
jgi:hypothetical protein